MKKQQRQTPMVQLDETRRRVLHEHLSSPRWQGEQRGVYHLGLCFAPTVALEVTHRERRLLRQVDALLRRIVDENGPALTVMARANGEGQLRHVAWRVLEPVRCVFFAEGDYRTNFPGGYVVTYRLSAWDAQLLAEYDQLLTRLYQVNPTAVDQLLPAFGGGGPANGEYPALRRTAA